MAVIGRNQAFQALVDPPLIRESEFLSCSAWYCTPLHLMTQVLEPPFIACAGQYEVIERLGKGHLGTMFLARDKDARERVVRHAAPHPCHPTCMHIRCLAHICKNLVGTGLWKVLLA